MAVQRQHGVRGMTYDEYCLLPDDGNRYEVLEGELVVSPSPEYPHQKLIWRLGPRLATFVETYKLGELIGAPMDVILAPDTIVQPDLFFICAENLGIVGRRVFGAPDLCVEVLSPGTSANDRHEKKELYARYGVREYWIIDTDRKTVAVFILQENTYGEGTVLSGDDTLRASVIEGFAIRAGDVFPE